MSRIYSSLSGGELFEKITEEGYTMSEAEVINYMRQVCEGVKHMHERNIIHLGQSFFQEDIHTAEICLSLSLSLSRARSLSCCVFRPAIACLRICWHG